MVTGAAAVKSEEKNAGIDMEKLKKEFEVLSRFIYVLNHTDGTHTSWMTFCEKERGGAQDLEQLSKLVSSVNSPRPWRFIVDEKIMAKAERADKLDKILEEVFVGWDQVKEDVRKVKGRR